jgi:hypothetical protein
LFRGRGYQYPVSLKQNRQISHIPKIYFRSKAKNIPKNTQNDNAISHIPSNSEDTYTISLKIKWQISRIPIYHTQGSVVGRYSTYFVTKDTKSLSKYKTTIFTIFASQGLRFGSPFSPPLADLKYILKFTRNATWWFIEVAPLR